MTNRISSNVFWSFSKQIFVSAAAFGTTVLFARLVSQDDYGAYLYCMSLIGLANVLSMPGINTVVFRESAQHKHGILKKGLAFSLLWGSVAALTVWIFGAWYYDPQDVIRSGLSLVVVLLPLYYGFRVWEPFLKGLSQFKVLCGYAATRSIVVFGSILAGILSGLSVPWLVFLTVAAISVVNLLAYLQVRRLCANQSLGDSWAKQAYSLTFLDFSTSIFAQVDVLILGALLDLKSVAIYGVIMRCGNAVRMLIRAALEAYLPKLFVSDGLSLRFWIRLAAISVLLPLGALFLLDEPFLLLFGEKYRDSILGLKIYLFVIPIFILVSITTSELIRRQMNWEINLSRILGIVSVVAAYYLLIPKWGVIGGVIASMIFFIVILLSNLFFVLKPDSKH